MRDIMTSILYAMQEHGDTVLVTIVESKGSSPRGAGSMMLVGKKGLICGSIGGGAVEKLGIEQATECLNQKKPAFVRYNLFDQSTETSGKCSEDADITGMICGGEVAVDFHYIAADDEDWKDIAKRSLSIMDNGGRGCLELDVASNDEGVTMIESDECGSPRFDGKTAYIPFKPDANAILFGAGHIGKALCPLLKTLSFNVTVVDDRADYVTRERFPDADRLIVCDFGDFRKEIEPGPEDYIIIMTSGHKHDLTVESQVLRTQHKYVGMVGSKRKIATANERLRELGISEDMIRFVHTPVGLDIGAITPEEIAVSIAAEIVAVRHGKDRDNAQI